jgi:hypothetical protein
LDRLAQRTSQLAHRMARIALPVGELGTLVHQHKVSGWPSWPTSSTH